MDELIRARKIVAAHACETFTMARWIEQPDLPNAPRPLRDAIEPWGMTFGRLREVCPCATGSILFMQAVKLLMLTWLHGGAVSLEHGDRMVDLVLGVLEPMVPASGGPPVDLLTGSAWSMLTQADHLPAGASARNGRTHLPGL